MDAVKYLKMRDRMLRFYGADDSNCSRVACECCPLSGVEHNECFDHTPESVDIVEAWNKEHPVKTYKDDFLEKYPNALLKHSGEPKGCIVDLGYVKHNGTCAKPNLSCRDCWNTEMERL